MSTNSFARLSALDRAESADIASAPLPCTKGSVPGTVNVPTCFPCPVAATVIVIFRFLYTISCVDDIVFFRL